jgi:DNA-binding transcriptional MerR regulator
MSDWDRQTTPDAAEGPQWVSAAEAADVAGVTPGTVRYWARNGLIVSEVVQGPAGEKTLVRLDEVVQHARQGSPSGHGEPGAGHRGASQVVTDLPARTSELAPILKSIPEIMAQLTAATDRAARAETKVEFLSAQLADLRRRLAEAEGGRGGSFSTTLPETWEEPSRPGEVAGAGASAPGSTGWPSPAEAAPGGADLGASTSDPAPGAGTAPWGEAGPPSIDWSSGARDATVPPAEEPSGAPSRGSGRLSLEELWAQPSDTPTPAPEAQRPEATKEPETVEWHEPAWPASRGDEAAAPASSTDPERPPPAGPANATIPEEDLYGPRRRWFRRRRRRK